MYLKSPSHIICRIAWSDSDQYISRTQPLSTRFCTINLGLNPRNTSTLIPILARRTPDIHVLNLNIRARLRAAAHEIPNQRVILLARGTRELLDRHI